MYLMELAVCDSKWRTVRDLCGCHLEPILACWPRSVALYLYCHSDRNVLVERRYGWH